MYYIIRTENWKDKQCFRDRNRCCSTISCSAWYGDSTNGWCYLIYGKDAIGVVDCSL